MDLQDFLNIDSLKEYGIVDFGITNDPIPSTLKHYNKWVEEGNHGPLSYLSGDRQEKRQSLNNYFPEFKSAIVFLFSYAEAKKLLDDFYESPMSNGLKIASYVLGFGGVDYHFEVKDRLNQIKTKLQEIDPELIVELSLDIQPVLERDLAKKAGVGWFGKNSMMINTKHGSFVIIGSLLLNKDISYIKETKLETDHCGQCTRCIDACPTDAIIDGQRTLDTNKCISTFTIEIFKEAEPPKKMENGNGEIYGCDICQDVCPWNKRLFRKNFVVSERAKSEFESDHNQSIIDYFLKEPTEKLISDLEGLSNRGFQKMWCFSPISRTGRRGLLKNLFFWKK